MLTIFSTRTCVWCKAVERYLQMKKVQYEKVMVDDDPETRQMLFEKTGYMAVPVTTNGTDYVLGNNWARINELIATL
jgi:glutaredoxin 3